MCKEIESLWSELVLSDSLFHKVERDYQDMMRIAETLDNNTGFRLIKESKKLNLKTYMQQDPGQRNVALRYEISRAKIPFFNLLCMLYETSMYDMWFPNSMNCLDVRIL